MKGHEDDYIAVTKNQILTLRNVCASAKERGGFTGNIDDLISHIETFFREMVYLLRDGYGINLAGLLVLYLNIGGYLPTPNAQPDPKTNPLTLNARRLSGATKVVENIHIVNWGLEPTPNRIDRIIDAKTGSKNNIVTPGSPFTLEGVKIKAMGTPVNPGDTIGVGFRALDSPNLTVWVTETLISNEPSKIIGIVPALPPDKVWSPIVSTRFSGGKRLLKEPREIMARFSVRVAQSPAPE
jgi:hypothetical protein